MYITIHLWCMQCAYNIDIININTSVHLWKKIMKMKKWSRTLDQYVLYVRIFILYRNGLIFIVMKWGMAFCGRMRTVMILPSNILVRCVSFLSFKGNSCIERIPKKKSEKDWLKYSQSQMNAYLYLHTCTANCVFVCLTMPYEISKLPNRRSLSLLHY